MNNDALPHLLFWIVVAVTAFIWLHKSDPETKRRRDLAALARKLQLKFSPPNDFKLAERYSFLSWLRRGDVRYAYNVLRGVYSGNPVIVFDYHFSTPGGKSGYDYYWSAYVLEMKTNFPDVLISPETMESRLTEVLGGSDIAFESAHFSHEFRVRASNRKFAFDVCHPGMMEYLLANRDLTVEINGTGLALLFEDWLCPEKVEFNLSRLLEIRKLLPDYLFTKNT
jgi:hypothetical protein